MRRENAETSKEALLLAISIGSRPLVEMILSLFREFAGEESRGMPISASVDVNIHCRLHFVRILSTTYDTVDARVYLATIFAIASCLLLRNHAIDFHIFPIVIVLLRIHLFCGRYFPGVCVDCNVTALDCWKMQCNESTSARDPAAKPISGWRHPIRFSPAFNSRPISSPLPTPIRHTRHLLFIHASLCR